MLSINTNLSSLIAQNSLTQSTSKLNQAIERMSTGFKINHASDNAANYSISTNMTTKMSAYQVAEDNVSMGLDMLTTASENLSQIESKLARLRALATQASNGTYGTQSKDAINSEANALVDEIKRLNNTGDYNGIDLNSSKISDFVLDIERRDTTNMTSLSAMDENTAITSGTYSISTAEELAQLARMTNKRLINANTEFVLANNIDLAEYCKSNESTGGWTPIGNGSTYFAGKFDGNGYVISNLYISNSLPYQGLFGNVEISEISNLGVENCNIYITGRHAGGIASRLSNSKISNCYVTGNIESDGGAVGGLVGYSIHSDINYSYSKSNVTSNYNNSVGGLTGAMDGGTIMNCFATGEIIGTSVVGGIAGTIHTNEFKIINSYAECNLTSLLNSSIGGIAGNIQVSGEIDNCYSNSFSNNTSFGGLIGLSKGGTIKITNSSVLNSETNYSGIFVSTNYIANPASIILENNSYNSKITSTNLTVGNKKSFSEGIITETGTNTCSSNPKFIISTDAVVKENRQNINLQIGINSDSNSSLSFEMDYFLENIGMLRGIGLVNSDFLTIIDKLSQDLSNKQTQYGAVQNRLESALDEIAIQYDNLASSRSTLRDADMAELSSTYIQQQILQQASATLLATANQSPSIALQLI